MVFHVEKKNNFKRKRMVEGGDLIVHGDSQKELLSSTFHLLQVEYSF